MSMTRRVWILVAAVMVGVVAWGIVWWQLMNGGVAPSWVDPNSVTITVTEYHPPPVEESVVLADDRLEDKKTVFDPSLVDRRPEGQWIVNSSEAVIQLDAPVLRPDVDAQLLVLNRSYADAIAAVRASPLNWETILPSVNMVDGKAKQFDDGLYAALEQASFQGKSPKLPNRVAIVRRLFGRVGPNSPASPFLAAGLALVGEKVKVANAVEKDRRLSEFMANEVQSKPIGFYTWSKSLSDGFRFLRFFQQPLDQRDLALVRALLQALADDKQLKSDYQSALAFDARMTNPAEFQSLAELFEKNKDAIKSVSLPPGRATALFPPALSAEAQLFRKLFPVGLLPGANLIRSLIARIRSGEVDLAPRPNSGWYDHQVFALETLLLPEKGEESPKLLLTKLYKMRMLEAFKSLMTKRRETHVRELGYPTGAAAPPSLIAPRLRVEPCPSFYLRTARAYSFLAAFLESALGDELLGSLHGLREHGERPQNLRDELASMRDLFYGLYFLSAEDIGLKPKLVDDEPAERDRCERMATEWLGKAFADPDIAADTRVSVPVYVDLDATRLWATLGVRMARLTASFARPPRIRPRERDRNGSEPWQFVESFRLATAEYLIPVDEFAEISLRGSRVLTHDELRGVCDRKKTKEAIISALEH
jgi:hypothetical protein